MHPERVRPNTTDCLQHRLIKPQPIPERINDFHALRIVDGPFDAGPHVTVALGGPSLPHCANHPSDKSRRLSGAWPGPRNRKMVISASVTSNTIR